MKNKSPYPKSSADIAAELNVEESTVRVLLMRAYQKLRKSQQLHRFCTLVCLASAQANADHLGVPPCIDPLSSTLGGKPYSLALPPPRSNARARGSH